MPITIPVVNGASVDPKFIPKEGQDVKALPSAFGVSSADDMGRGFMSVSKSMEEHEENQANILATDATNKLNQFQLDTLYHGENAYFKQQGKAALGQEQALSEAWDKQVNDIADAMPNKMAQAKFKAIGGKSKLGYLEGIYSHANAQAINYQKDVMANGIEVNSQLAFANRNNPLVVDKYIGNIRGVIAANAPDKSPEAIQLLESEAISKMHVANISGMLADHNLMAQGYYEQYKNQISPEVQGTIMKNIKENDADVKSRMTADSLFHSGVGEQDAFAQAHAIKDLDLRDATESKLSYLYGRQRELKNQTYSDNLDKFWNDYEKNPDINNIPAWMEGKDRIAARNYAVKDGKPETDPNAYVNLYEMKLNNAGEFAKVDLNQYRDSLTKDDYKTLRTAQMNIQQHGFTSITPDDDAVNQIAETFGSWNKPKNEVIASQMQSIIQEEERRNGSKYSEKELPAVEERIGKWLKYSKEGSTPFVLEQNKSKAGFYKGLSNDVAYFRKVHGREPDQKEFHSLLYQRAARSVQSRNENAYKNIQAKPHETKELTYHVDKEWTDWSKKNGIKVTVTSRYRNQEGSHHKEGISSDVSMSEHSFEEKKKIMQASLNNPLVRKVGTSDKDLLAAFSGNPKIVDERAYDAKHGTNHKNHMHETLAAKPIQDGSRVLVVNANGQRGYVPQNQLAQALKAGYKKV